ncbi:MAG: leucine-rich repeat domain-containing protein [Holosporales bacterium]|nr:leucine-rich repeat domain-containing protein [Holosporales bacterium]
MGCFSGCRVLESITFERGSQLRTIGDGAFSGCRSLRSISIPASMETIGYGCFHGCSNLSRVEFESDFQLINIRGNAIPKSAKIVVARH